MKGCPRWSSGIIFPYQTTTKGTFFLCDCKDVALDVYKSTISAQVQNLQGKTLLTSTFETYSSMCLDFISSIYGSVHVAFEGCIELLDGACKVTDSPYKQHKSPYSNVRKPTMKMHLHLSLCLCEFRLLYLYISISVSPPNHSRTKGD